MIYPLDLGADAALRKAVDTAPPWRMTFFEQDHADSVLSATFSPDGRHIVTASADFTARVWVARVEDLLELAEFLVQREPPTLTQVERERFLGE